VASPGRPAAATTILLGKTPRKQGSCGPLPEDAEDAEGKIINVVLVAAVLVYAARVEKGCCYNPDTQSIRKTSV
jgi:hypothetical protein